MNSEYKVFKIKQYTFQKVSAVDLIIEGSGGGGLLV